MDQRKKKRMPVKVERRAPPVQTEQQQHEELKQQQELARRRFVPMPRRHFPRGQMGEGGPVEIKSSTGQTTSSVSRLLSEAKVTQERTGFDVLQLSYDKDVYPTTLPVPGKAQKPKMASFANVLYTCDGVAAKKQYDRRHCELIEEAEGIFFVHKLRPSAADPGVRIPLAGGKVEMDAEGMRVSLESGKHRVQLRLEDSHTCELWRDLLEVHIKQDESDKSFEEYLEEAYVGLDFLAEVKREERTRIRNNRELFGVAEGSTGQFIEDDELVLIQLPHMLPSALGSRSRSNSPALERGAAGAGGGAAGGAGAAGKPSGTPGQRDESKHKPGSGWTGRALGAAHHKSSLASFPPGKIGKIEIHKSGKIKMQIGDCMYDVSSGGEAAYAQTLMEVYSAEAKYRATGFGPGGCPVYSKPSLAAQTGLKKMDGEVITVVQEQQTEDGYFLHGVEGWVLRESAMGGKWVQNATGEHRPRAYELGRVGRKLVVTPDFDKLR